MSEFNTAELGIREMNGVISSSEATRDVLLREGETSVLLEASTTSSISMRPAVARRLARMLHRMATRIEKRLEAGANQGESE